MNIEEWRDQFATLKERVAYLEGRLEGRIQADRQMTVKAEYEALLREVLRSPVSHKGYRQEGPYVCLRLSVELMDRIRDALPPNRAVPGPGGVNDGWHAEPVPDSTLIEAAQAVLAAWDGDASQERADLSDELWTAIGKLRDAVYYFKAER